MKKDLEDMCMYAKTRGNTVVCASKHYLCAYKGPAVGYLDSKIVKYKGPNIGFTKTNNILFYKLCGNRRIYGHK